MGSGGISSGLFGVYQSAVAYLSSIDGIALAFALLTPLLLIYGRHEMRHRRLLTIKDFLQSFPRTLGTGAADAAGTTYGNTGNPSMEFVRSKYISDIRLDAATQEKFDNSSALDQIMIIVRNARFFGSLGDLRLLVSSVGLMMVIYFGITSLRQSIELAFCACCVTSPAPPNCSPKIQSVQIIGSLAFAGGYLAAIRAFIRGLAVFDLSSFTFIRYTAEILISVLFVAFIFLAIPNPEKIFSLLTWGTSSSGSAPASLSPAWIILAPVIGFIPDSATKFALLRVQSAISWVKMDDDRFNRITRITPLDVLDGIDYHTRFRLEECGIRDVQGLATYNPIMLHIESPYGIYQAVDWISQAQLCHLVGIEKYLLLRELEIRTIFDLERAIDFRIGDVESPNEFDRLLAGILLAPSANMREISDIGGIKPLLVGATSTVSVDVDTFCRNYLGELTKTPETTKQCVEHMMGWISDDLHVRRLRRIWQDISATLGKQSYRLDAGDGEQPRPPLETINVDNPGDVVLPQDQPAPPDEPPQTPGQEQ